MAKQSGITDVAPDCLPEDKMAAIDCYRQQGEPVCMAGDGVNDAPALSALPWAASAVISILSSPYFWPCLEM